MAMRPSATSARDAGLALISRVNRWMIAGAVAATGVISVAAAKSFHGHTVATGNTASQSAPASSSSSRGAASNSGSGSSLQTPSQAPAASAASSAPVVSGGS